jgi:hypothetical protein
MSSKFDASFVILSGLSNCEDWKEEDFEDLDPERSGGELGAVVVVVIS